MLSVFGAKSGDKSKKNDSILAALNKAQAIIYFDLDGAIREANENFLGAVGYGLDEIKGQHHRMFVEADYASSAEYAKFWERLAKGEFFTGEYKRIAKGGKEIWIEASYNPLLDANGKPEGVVKFAIDVTDKKLEKADADGRLDAISKSNAVIEFELDGTILNANENFLDGLGYRLDEIKGQHHRMFVDPTYASSQEYAQFWRDLANGSFDAGEYQRFGKGGREIWIQASYNPIFDLNGKPFKVVKYATDITGRKQALAAFSEALGKLSDGDLTARLDSEVTEDFRDLRDSFNNTMERLLGMVRDIQAASIQLAHATETISSGALELSGRTESQASSLEETAATMEEVSASIKANAENAHGANEAAGGASERAKRGGEVVGEAIDAMEKIEGSSSKIAEIISVIESIAFQTNLLALNAAVEAARAGEAGAGFAVVASEVRTLAQRSSEAAKDITDLIQESSGHVGEGARLVRQTGEALSEINEAIETVASNIGGISSASREQASGVEEISRAVSHMDEMTQKNSSLAEQSASHARSLNSEADGLRQLVSFFDLGEGSAKASPQAEAKQDDQWRQAEQAQPAPAAPAAAAAYAAASGDDFAEF